jgi:hypothetical protein
MLKTIFPPLDHEGAMAAGILNFFLNKKFLNFTAACLVAVAVD